MIKCISFYEDKWMIRAADRVQWKNLTRAFGAEFELYDLQTFTWDDALHNPNGLPVYVFEESGGPMPTSKDLEGSSGAIFVFGVTGMDVSKLIPGTVVRIETPEPVPLWGCEAAAIALDRLT